MRFCYADPPYVGQARKHYGREEVDHAELIARLDADYDAWALSASSPSLRQLLPMCPEDCRVLSWVKPFAIFKPGVRVAYAWEPIIIRGWRKGDRTMPTVRDWCSENITLRRGLSGAKPENVCHWLFDVMGLTEADEMIDLFPGTGAVTRAWQTYFRRQQALIA